MDILIKNSAVDGCYIPSSRYVFMHCHKVDETYGILRLVYGVADENLAVSSYDKHSCVVENMYRLSYAIRFGENEIKAIVWRSKKFLDEVNPKI